MRNPPLAEAEIHSLWDELADFPAVQSDAALEHLMRRLCVWLRADDAFWVGAVRMASGAAGRRDAQHGWRGRAVRFLRPSEAMASLSRQGIREQDTDPPMTTCAITRDAGAFRVRTMHDGLLDLAAFRSTGHYKAFYEAQGIQDRMWAVFPASQDAESYLVFDRIRSERRFAAADLAIATRALRGLKWFLRQVLLSHNLLLARDPLTSVQRRLLFLLLGSENEKRIAANLGLTPGTTHQYVVDICRKFGVQGRVGLMALWTAR